MSLLGLVLPMLFVSGVLASQATPAAAGLGISPIVWELVGYTETNGQPTDITDPARYSLQFLPDGRLLARFDCKMGRGGFTAADGALTLTPMAAALKGCPARFPGPFLCARAF